MFETRYGLQAGNKQSCRTSFFWWTVFSLIVLSECTHIGSITVRGQCKFQKHDLPLSQSVASLEAIDRLLQRWWLVHLLAHSNQAIVPPVIKRLLGAILLALMCIQQ